VKSDRLQELINRRLAPGSAQVPDDVEAAKMFPILHQFLTRTDVNGEFAKDPAAVTIRCGLGSWLVELTDPTLEVGLTSVSPTLAGCLDALERALGNPQAAFRPWKGSQGKFKRKVKKGGGQEGS
jgi:hypothetical protein